MAETPLTDPELAVAQELIDTLQKLDGRSQQVRVLRYLLGRAEPYGDYPQTEVKPAF